MEDFDSKDIYLKKDNEIIGLHAIGIAGPYEFTLSELDGTNKLIKTNFMELEKWGNVYDENYNIVGRGSFRVFDLTLEHAAEEFEKEGYVRFERKT